MTSSSLRILFVTLAGCTLSGGFAVPPANAQVRLATRFEPGQLTRTRMVTRVHQKLTVGPQVVETGNEQTVVSRVVVGRPNGEGLLPVEHQVTGLEVTLQLPGNVQLEYDSKQPAEKPSGAQFEEFLSVYKAMLGHRWVEYFDAQGQLHHVQGREALLAKLDDELLRELAAQQLSNERQQQSVRDSLAQLPDRVVSPGDRWTRQSTKRLGAGQAFECDTEFTYAGTVDVDGQPLHKISSATSQVRYARQTAESSPFKVVDSQLQVAESAGQLLFDPELQRIVSSRESLHITGELTFEIAGQKLPGKLDLTFQSSVDVQPVR